MNPPNLPTNIFVVNWNTDASTNTLFALTNPPSFPWSNFTFVVTATSTNVQLQFEAQNDQNAFGLDDVSVAPEQFGIGAVGISGQDLVLTVLNGVSGLTCRVLSAPDPTLPLSQWTPIATNVLAQDGTFTFTVTNALTSGAPQKFYILQAP
jgi:hypothetical protein